VSSPVLPASDQDLWTRAWFAIQQRPPGFFKAKWVKGHVLDRHRDYIELGYVSEQDAQGNSSADALADEGRLEHAAVPIHLVKLADSMCRLATATHKMFLAIWKDRKKDILDSHNDPDEALKSDCEGAPPVQVEAPPKSPIGATAESEAETVSQPPAGYRALKEANPQYLWEVPSPSHALNTIIVGSVDTRHRGKLLCRTFTFPIALWEPFLVWLSQLTWPSVEECEHNNWTCTFAELAIDLELFAGLRIEEHALGSATSWHRKAVLVKCMFQTACRHCEGLRGWHRVLKTTRQSTLTSYRIPRVIGLPVRPRFVMGRATEYLVAKNAYRYSTPNTLPCKKREEGYLRLPVTYEGSTARAKWVPAAHQRLASAIASQAVRRRLRGKQSPDSKTDQPNETT